MIDPLCVDVAVLKEKIAHIESESDRRYEAVKDVLKNIAGGQDALARKAEVELRFASIEDKVADITEFNTRELGSKAGSSAAWAYVVGAVGTTLGILGALSNHFHF